MKSLLVPARTLYVIYALVVFVLLMLLITPLVLAASFFGRIKGGNMIYRLCTFWAGAWFLMVGIFHKNIHEVPHDKSKQYIFVTNHISYLDAAIVVKTIRQPVRVLGKIELSKVLLFGFIYRKAIVTVDRTSAAHRANSVRILKSVVKKGISIFMFPEGTFNETHKPLKEFFDGAFRIAIETKTPIKPVLFIDAYDRMHYRSVFTLSPGRSRSVFLDEVSVEGLTMKDVPSLKRLVHEQMETALIRYRAGWIEQKKTVTA